MKIEVIGTGNVEHDGIVYAPGDVIEDITDEQAQALVDGGVAKLAGDKKAKGGVPKDRKQRTVVAPGIGKGQAGKDAKGNKVETVKDGKDVWTKTTYPRGQKQYRLNGKIVTGGKAGYEAAAAKVKK